MHASERTLLASLGFNDPDKKGDTHDMAIQYLAQPLVLGRLLEAATRRVPQRVAVVWTSLTTEYHLTKGEGKYKTTVGFADLLVRYAAIDQQRIIAARWEAVWDRASRTEGLLSEVRWWFEALQKAECFAWNDQGAIRVVGEPPTYYSVTGQDLRARFMEEKAGDILPLLPTLDLRQGPYGIEKSGQGWKETLTNASVWLITDLLLVEVKITPVALGDVIRQRALYAE